MAIQVSLFLKCNGYKDFRNKNGTLKDFMIRQNIQLQGLSEVLLFLNLPLPLN